MTVKLDKAFKDRLIQELSHPYGYLSLICDGRKITLDVRKSGNLKYGIMTFVDGEFKGEWANPKLNAPESKFLRKKTVRLYSAAEKATIIKKHGVRFAKTLGVDKTTFWYVPHWSSGRSVINHLCNVCDSIEVVEPEPVENPLKEVADFVFGALKA